MDGWGVRGITWNSTTQSLLEPLPHWESCRSPGKPPPFLTLEVISPLGNSSIFDVTLLSDRHIASMYCFEAIK